MSKQLWKARAASRRVIRWLLNANRLASAAAGSGNLDLFLADETHRGSVEQCPRDGAAASTAQVRDDDYSGHEMLLTRIAIRQGRSPKFKQALIDEIFEAIRETIQIKDGDRFMTITEHSTTEFAYGSFLGIERSDDLVQIQIFSAPGKTAEGKLAMYNAIVERLGRNPGVRPEDVLICVVETAPENWSLGNGEAQFYHARLTDPPPTR